MKPVDAPHPGDERLILRYFDSAAVDEALERHLRQCAACAWRASALAAALDADHDRTFGAADAAFGAARLDRQRDAILDRLARDGRAALAVLPGHRLPAPAAARLVRGTRWVAAAAMLVFSVTLGSGSWFGRSDEPRDRFTDAPMLAAVAPAGEGDEALLLEIDRALTRPQTRELRALEALTPRADELVEF